MPLCLLPLKHKDTKQAALSVRARNPSTTNGEKLSSGFSPSLNISLSNSHRRPKDTNNLLQSSSKEPEAPSHAQSPHPARRQLDMKNMSRSALDTIASEGKLSGSTCSVGKTDQRKCL